MHIKYGHEVCQRLKYRAILSLLQIKHQTMAINIGKTDKYIRLLLGIIIILSGIVFQSWWGLIGVVLITTAFANWCPLYALLGTNTCTPKNRK
jgi:hypothetical protein